MLDATGIAATSMAMQRTRLAVVLFNLGGPDSPEAVRPFLINLFKDPAILRVPFFVRPLLARIIAIARTKPATANYEILGGSSPLLRLTEEQARALEAELPEFDVRCFVAMRYWHPFSDAVAREVRDWGADEVVLLPLYPQYSTTTTGSSLTAWREAAAQANLVVPVTTLCCYHADPGYVSATANGVRRAYEAALTELDGKAPLRVLFSAHGLPETIVKRADPYQVPDRTHRRRDGEGAGDLGAGLVGLLPVARHSAKMARSQHGARDRAGGGGQSGCVGGADRVRVGAFRDAGRAGRGSIASSPKPRASPGISALPHRNADAAFIQSLATLVRGSRARGPGLCSWAGGRTCPRDHTDCPHARAGQTAPEPALV